MEYEINFLYDNKVVLKRLTKIEKTDNGLVNAMHDYCEVNYVSMDDIKKYYFSSSTDGKREGYLIEKIDICNENSDSTFFDVYFYSFVYSKFEGEYICRKDKDRFYVLGNDSGANKIRDILYRRVDEFNCNERQTANEYISSKTDEINRLRNMKLEVLKLIDMVLKDDALEKFNISYDEYKDYVSFNEEYVRDYVKENWKFKKILDIFVEMGSIGSLFSLLPALYFQRYDIFTELWIAVFLFLCSSIVIDDVVSSKVIKDAGDMLLSDDMLVSHDKCKVLKK